MLASIFGYLIFASTASATLAFSGLDVACEDAGQHAYVLDFRFPERMDSGLYRVTVVETLKGSPSDHWEVNVPGLMHWIGRSRMSEEDFLKRVRRAYVIVLEDSSVLNIPGCRPVLEVAGNNEESFEQEVLTAKTYIRLRDKPALGDVLSALRSPQEGKRVGAMKVLHGVDPKSVPGESWDAVGMAVVDDLRQRPLEEMSRDHYAVLFFAAVGARKWHGSQGLPPPAWLRRAGDAVFKRLEAGVHAGRFCDLFHALLDEEICSAEGDLGSSSVRMRLRNRREQIPVHQKQ